MNKIILDKSEVSEKSPCYVIAEVGHNHQGNIESCKNFFRGKIIRSKCC